MGCLRLRSDGGEVACSANVYSMTMGVSGQGVVEDEIISWP